MKGDIMSKRIYHLTIEFDPDTEEVEYILETIDEVGEDYIQLVQIGSIDLEKYFDKETLREILQNYEVGEA
jgi:Ca2+-binding EF-hand superfamily protein